MLSLGRFALYVSLAVDLMEKPHSRPIISIGSIVTANCEVCKTKRHKQYVSIFCSWNTARDKADLQDVRIHDLPHSYASFLVNAGHTQIKTTQRYAHLNHDTLLDATNSVNTALGEMFVPMVSASPAAQVQLVQ